MFAAFNTLGYGAAPDLMIVADPGWHFIGYRVGRSCYPRFATGAIDLLHYKKMFKINYLRIQMLGVWQVILDAVRNPAAADWPMQRAM